jgi:hypothetical protein
VVGTIGGAGQPPESCPDHRRHVASINLTPV